MRLHRLHIQSFAAIENLDVEFGPGLNVLYGPNDLGKSTAVSAIRLGLLLPHTSTHCEQYIGWASSDDPIVEVTFETEAQRIWRVRKQFGRSGSSLLQESRDGQDFDDVERGRKVDAKLREILRWGIPEPGGTGGAKGLPTSFLATVLLSPQEDVSAALGSSLDGDATSSAKDQIAAALQAVAQDPLFIALLREIQVRRDTAYTDKGAKKTAKGSVFKEAAERVKYTREEKEKLERIVADSESVERQLRELIDRRTQKQEALAAANSFVANLETSAAQAKWLSVASEQVRLAQEDVLRIQRIGNQAEEAERDVIELVEKIREAEQELSVTRNRQSEADAALKGAEDAQHAEGSDPGVTDTIVRQQLELRKSDLDRVAQEAQQRIDVALTAQKHANALVEAERALNDQREQAELALESVSKARAKSKVADEQLQRCDLLERALDVVTAGRQVRDAQVAVDKEMALRARLETASREHVVLTGQRSAITVPTHAAVGAMRKLSRELDAALAALDVGFVVTVKPEVSVDIKVRKDGQELDSTSLTKPVEIEANAEVEVCIAEIATVSVRGGRRAAQERAQHLKERWTREVEPHLIAAAVTDLDGLESKMAEAQELDTNLKAKHSEMESLRVQVSELTGSVETLREASERLEACRALLGDVELETLTADINALGADPIAGLRSRRQHLSKEAEEARRVLNQASNDQTLADERTRRARLALDEIRAAHDAALTAFPDGVNASLVAARAALAAANSEKVNVTAELASLERTIDQRKKHIDEALNVSRRNAEQAKIGVDTAQGQLTTAKTNHASQEGRLIELRRQRDAENLVPAEASLSQAIQRHAALPVPDRLVTDEEVTTAQANAARIKLELESIERDIQKAHGALEQVGGAVARERLRDATEAFELAERQEKEVEAEYEAWKLLLEQMKEADAAQASNLGQALVPAIATRFQELTKRRYQTVQLTAQLATQGVMVSGTLRSTEQISVGTREQLSTLYRLALAEYLRTVIVLDDQLVQSDSTRMDWFRKLLTEKAQIFQIVVFTCRPGDYLPANALVPKGKAVHSDTKDGLTRAVDLGRALHRR
jgi:GH24 family phage-related lysozyme (muramidase)